VGAYHYYNDIQIPDTYAFRRATYARLPLSSDYHKYAGARDIRIVAGADIVLPHFIRRVPAAQISGGSEQPDVIFSRQERGKRVYVLRLPEPPEGKFYDMLEVSSDRDFEATVQVSTGSEADALRSQGYYSIYRYDQGGDENRLISFYRGDRDLTNRYIRLESDSDAPLYFRAAYISGEYDRAEFKIDFDVDALDSYDDGDRDAMVYYLKNERRHNLKRLELVFADKRFNRRVEIEVYDEEDKYYRFLMSGRVVSEGEADTTQILELPSAQPRELKIIIEHGDDEPLELKSMAGYVPAEEVVIDLSRIDFILEAGEKPNQFRMYYGNDYAEWPDYDLDVTYDSAQPHITVRSLEHQENPEFAYSIVEPPLSIWIIRALFLIGLAALSIPGVRIFTRFAQERQKEQGESQSAPSDT
ncbi:MAG: hypothetical protein KDK30_00725, partial [Leptospiraceae bacterium]|nr:hypothetical protein [Leptospiraceae bacterium]